MNPTTPVRFAPDVILQEINGEAIVISLDREVLFALNGPATAIARLLGTGVTIDAAAEAIAAEYGIDPLEARREVDELVDSLRGRGLIVGGDAV